MVLLILAGVVGILWLCALLMDMASRAEEEEFPGYLLARHVPPATLEERQQARRERLACAGCPVGRDPIDVELEQMIRVDAMLQRGEFP